MKLKKINLKLDNKKKKQEEKIKQHCRDFKEKNPNAPDKAVLSYAFSTLYGKRGPTIVQKLMKDPNAFHDFKDHWINLDNKQTKKAKETEED